MWNSDSFATGGGAGDGWGDSSFQTGANAGGAGGVSLGNLDKVSLPVRVPDLNKISPNEEKILIGSYAFNTVRVVGQIVGVVKMDSSQYIEYSIQDMDDPTRAVITVLEFKSGGGEDMKHSFVEETVVQVVGKLRSFENRLSIVALHIREIDDPQEVNTHRLEAQLAELYYSKNVPQMALSHDLDKFAGTMLRGPGDGSASHGTHLANTGPSPRKPMPPASTSHTTGNAFGGSYVMQQPAVTSSSGNSKGLSGQRALLYDFIKREGSANERGVSRDMLNHMQGVNRARLAEDLNFLFSEGHIFSTTDDDHFSVVE